MFTSNPVHTARNVTCAAAVAASVLVQSTALACGTPLEPRNLKLAAADPAIAASPGTTQVSGIGVFNTECLPPVGSPPADPGDYPPVDLSGSLVGCWYTYVSEAKFNRSGTYQERGSEIFVGCLNGTCGTFETTYTFTAKYVDDTFAEEIHGRCHHPIVRGTEGFAGAKGLINFKDDVVNLMFDYKGHISLE